MSLVSSLQFIWLSLWAEQALITMTRTCCIHNNTRIRFFSERTLSNFWTLYFRDQYKDSVLYLDQNLQLHYTHYKRRNQLSSKRLFIKKYDAIKRTARKSMLNTGYIYSVICITESETAIIIYHYCQLVP